MLKQRPNREQVTICDRPMLFKWLQLSVRVLRFYSNPKWVVKYADKLGRGNPTLGCPGGRGRQRKALPLQVFTNDLGLLYTNESILSRFASQNSRSP